MTPSENFYETDRAASEYLLLHYGDARQLPAFVPVPPELLNFPTRVVDECLAEHDLPPHARALDLGSAVGRSSFELARHCTEVVGIEYSQNFVAIADRLKETGSLSYTYVEEGELTRPAKAVVPKEIDRKRVRFQCGDAMRLSKDLGLFDVVLLANLIDRLNNPRQCLTQLPGLIKSGGRLVITSPYTWLKEYTPCKNWLGGFVRAGKPVKTIETLKTLLSSDFRLSTRRNIPFLIREHARKYQLSVAEASIWVRR